MDCVNDTKSKKGVKTEMMSDRGGRQETTWGAEIRTPYEVETAVWAGQGDDEIPRL